MRFKKFSYGLNFFLSFLFFIKTEGQIAVNFSPAIYGQTLDGLVYAQIMNSSGLQLKAKLTIKIREINGAEVAAIKTTTFTLQQGTNFINKTSFTNGKFNFSHNYYGSSLSQTGRLPEGEYEYCFEVDISESKEDQFPPLYENCFVFQLQPLTPLLLIDPVDEDEICEKRPGLTWQLPMPLTRESRSRLVLTELNAKQDVVDAINFNQPIINQGGIVGNNLTYPAGAPELKVGHKYVWQVSVYTEATILKKSEIWVFTVKCDEQQKIINTDSYRELKETDDGNYYIANKILPFSINNPYANGDLNYSIASMNDPGNPIKNLPKLKMYPGLNKYEIELFENRAFKANEEYLLRVKLANGRELKLRFIYKNE